MLATTPPIYAQLQDVPKFNYKPAVLVGQREIALGTRLMPETVMEVRFDQDVPSQIGEGRIPPPAWMEYAKGYVKWSVTDSTLFQKPCRLIKMDCLTRDTFDTKLHTIHYGSRNITQWWVNPDDKLIRQSVDLTNPNGHKHAEAVFWPDRIEVSIVDPKAGNRAFTLNPNIDMSLLDARFKPMVLDGKIVLQYKEYDEFDPFTQAFTKYKAEVRGNFHGTWLAQKFDGLRVQIDGPTASQTAFISKENDLIRVELTDNIAIVLMSLPPERDPMLNVLKKAGG